jgi:cell fate regulator YaaT (PSP1 superfamily)
MEGCPYYTAEPFSMGFHLVRYGLLGHVGTFAAVDALRYPRRSRVVVRSPRGLEVGEVLAEPEDRGAVDVVDGQILRRMTVQDDLLEARLQRRRHEAFEACQQLLAESSAPAALVDVEHLFDGEGLFFYFLGDPPQQATEITNRLAETYEAAVEFRKFADTLTEGCGPGCGTEEAKGQGGCASCTSCAVASACGTRK